MKKTSLMICTLITLLVASCTTDTVVHYLEAERSLQIEHTINSNNNGSVYYSRVLTEDIDSTGRATVNPPQYNIISNGVTLSLPKEDICTMLKAEPKLNPAKNNFFIGWYDSPTGGNLVSTEREFLYYFAGKTNRLYARFAQEKDASMGGNLSYGVKLTLNKVGQSLKYSEVTNIESLTYYGKNHPTNEIIYLFGIQDCHALKHLALESNNIMDIYYLELLDQLETVYLDDNYITDITPLIKNPGIGEGDRISLVGNNIPLIQIEALRNKGATVIY